MLGFIHNHIRRQSVVNREDDRRRSGLVDLGGSSVSELELF